MSCKLSNGFPPLNYKYFFELASFIRVFFAFVLIMKKMSNRRGCSFSGFVFSQIVIFYLYGLLIIDIN